MVFGKLYGVETNPRTIPLRVIAKANHLEIDFVGVDFPVSAEYLKINPVGKIPAFVGSNGFALTECIAIAVYFASQNENTTLLGKTKEDYASILKWMSFVNSDVISTLAKWYLPLLGREPYNKKNVDTAIASSKKILSVLEQHLLHHTFLVTEKLTLADILAAGIVGRGYTLVFDPEFRAEFPNMNRWWETVVNQPYFKEVVGELKFIDEAIKYTPPKKEEKKKEAPKAAPPKAEKKPAVDEEEEDAAPVEPKAKHPLDLLPKPTLPLDDWKRKYSNEDTRPVALPWFWEHYSPEEYSLWKVDYKYNDELTQIFMTSNLIGGFFNRLEASRKHIFGAMSVYGESNNSIVSGAFLVRGQDYLPAFDVAPDWESYEFTKLDPTKAEDREFIEDQWSWDKDYQGKKWADGKVFK
ncbi:elongation factor EF-1 gamma subunit [Terfezia boudieri ATCC MYA-4762]|uniref:Elongation factor EF-1 gamma subunit n=1 Tax=Terfezia boudieri ATCC MYA-4762 TaxID=1051890 RepID=A0A3N4LR61_9PEZI|nr:elongation factor EF-1 gamma subunit [Terfezia boudieri ATCC MYA-4762]